MKYLNISLLLVRIAGGGMMLTHGYPKFLKILNGNFSFGDPLGLGQEISLVLTVFAEFGCSILVILGLFTRLAALPLIFTMLVAVFIVHGGDPFGKQELGLMYLTLYTLIALNGPGKYSLDQLKGKRNR